jgi:hypothetical protein
VQCRSYRRITGKWSGPAGGFTPLTGPLLHRDTLERHLAARLTYQIVIAERLIGADRLTDRFRRVEVQAEYYRGQAQRCRALAKSATDWSIRQTLLDAAVEYDKLAERADKKRK